MGAAAGSIFGSIIGGQMAASAQDRATRAEERGQTNAINAQMAMYNQARTDQLPLINARNAALAPFLQILGLPAMQIPQATAGVGSGQQENFAQRQVIYDTYQRLGTAGQNDPVAAGRAESMLQANPWLSTYDPANPFGSTQTPTTEQPAAGATTQPLDLQTLIANTPGYQFQLGQGMQAIDRSAAARGSLMSGATIKAAQRYGTGLASQEFGNYANRLASLIGLGQTAATTAGGYGMQTGANVGQNYANIGAARGSGYANQGNIWGNTFSNVANTLGQNYGNNQTTNVQSGGSPYDQGAWMNYGYGDGG